MYAVKSIYFESGLNLGRNVGFETVEGFEPGGCALLMKFVKNLDQSDSHDSDVIVTVEKPALKETSEYLVIIYFFLIYFWELSQ